MRYRELTPTGDSTIFSGHTQFLVNSPQCVAQAVLTRLRLWQGQWFLDTNVGVPYLQQVIGFGTAGVRDGAIQNAILNTPGVNQILDYSSQLNGRALTITATIDTIYGTAPITLSL
jgi:hypothetical protein